MDNKFKISLDSDALRVLVYFCELTKDGTIFKYNNPKNIKNEHLQLNFEEYTYFFNAIKSRKVKLIVSKYVYNEVKHVQNNVDFINKYCHKNFHTDINNVEELAQAYRNPYIQNGQEMMPPMNKNYIAAINEEVPSNDCYIMADATVNHCNLLTNNLQDFIFDKTMDDPYNHRRLEGIKAINIQKGYKRKLLDKSEFIPQPIVLKKLNKLLRKHIENIKNNFNNSSETCNTLL